MACHSLSLMMIHLVSVRERKTTLGILSRKGCDCGELVTNGVQIQNRKAGVGKREKGLAYQRLESCCCPRCSHKHKKKQKKERKRNEKTLSSSYFPSPIGGTPAGNHLARELATIPKAWSWRLVKITDIGDP